MNTSYTLKPILKWAGGKRQLLPELLPLLPKACPVYGEPFVGGGALFLRVMPDVAYINDVNEELINVYTAIRDDVDALAAILAEAPNTREHFYALRIQDRDKAGYARLSPTARAARFIYLNKTCYNGLFRVNKSGEFNVPFGHYKAPNILNEAALRALNAYLRRADIHFTSLDYTEALAQLPPESFVYLDPPYDPLSATSSFTAYAKGGFGREEQVRLRDCCLELDKRGVSFMLSNSATEFVRELYAMFPQTVVRARRAVNADSSRRGHVDEVIVRNYV